MKRKISALLSLLLSAVLLFQVTGCGQRAVAADLMVGITANTVAGKEADTAFTAQLADFSVALFKKTITNGKNSLISPLSVMVALTMTANGAKRETLTQMETLLGGGIPIDTLNEYLYSYLKHLPSTDQSKLKLANSIWFRDHSFEANPDFLQKNADYYQATARKAPFDEQTCNEINQWIKENTDGMIDQMLDKIPEDAVMYLINALVFDAEWEKIYSEHAVRDGSFTTADGKEQAAVMMSAREGYYLEDTQATGFLKPYKDGHYSFAALLPKEGVSVEEYIAGLTGEQLLQLFQNPQQTKVDTVLPKFSYEYKIEMNDALKALGIPNAFDSGLADLSGLGTAGGNIYINRVLHKTFISVDEKGTKAGAATLVECNDEAAYPLVRLNRPFVYAIVDNATGLPIFLGTLMSVA